MMPLLTSRQKDLVTGTDRVTLAQHKSKMDQKSEEGIVHPMPRANDQRLCSVIKLEKWRRRRGVGLGLDNALFPTARDKNKGMPYVMYAKNLREAQLMSKLPRLTPHSWGGGYTTYVAAAGLDEATNCHYRQMAPACLGRRLHPRLEATTKALNF